MSTEPQTTTEVIPTPINLVSTLGLEAAFDNLLKALRDQCQPGRELSVAITEAETSRDWARKAPKKPFG